MIHHVHNLISSGTGTSSTGQPAKVTSSKASAASFQTALSDATTTSGPPNGGYDPFLQAAYEYNLSHPASTTAAASTAAASTSTASTAATSSDDAQQAFDNAYWAAQPAPVQALRNIQDTDQRTALAVQLAGEGYTIDVPIMAWGWDPSKVTSMRKADGYTWVPSALQNPVEDAPGLPAVGTIAAYDPNNPPAGSITV